MALARAHTPRPELGVVATTAGAMLVAALAVVLVERSSGLVSLEWPRAVSVVVLFITAGVGNIVVKDFMASVKVPTSPDARAEKSFDQPLLWNAITFLGMSFFLPSQACRDREERGIRGEDEEEAKRRPPLHALAAVMLLHWSSNYLVNWTYKTLPGSFIQMLRGSKVIFTCILSLLVFGRWPRAPELIGVVLAMVGIMVAGISAVETNSAAKERGITLGSGAHNASTSSVWTAVAVELLSEFLRSLLFVYQEGIMKRYAATPMMLTASVGALGLSFSLLVVAVSEGLQVLHLQAALYQLGHSAALVLCVSSFSVSISLFEFTGVSLTSMSTATCRAMLELLRVVVVWAVELALQWNVFNGMQCLGFGILVLGSMVQAEVIPLAFLTADSHRHLDALKDRGMSFFGSDSLPGHSLLESAAPSRAAHCREVKAAAA